MKYLLMFYPVLLFIQCSSDKSGERINRFEVINRHNIQQTGYDSLSSLTVGNGEFAYTVDLTGMQTFPLAYEKGIPLGTQSNWGWHSFPNDSNYQLHEVLEEYQSCNGKTVSYAKQPTSGRPQRAANWLRANPHHLHLAIIGLVLIKNNGEEMQLHEIREPVQTLNLWTGKIESKFKVDGVPVVIETLCHQQADLVAFNINSALISQGKLKIKIKYPGASDSFFGPGYDWENDDNHSSKIIETTENGATIKLGLDTTVYFAQLNWEGIAELAMAKQHHYEIVPKGQGDNFKCTVSFAPKLSELSMATFNETDQNNKSVWESFWQSGGAIDFGRVSDPRAKELERRIVLSQYLTKIQCSGSLPPQETGLIYNSWHGKFHLEMHWWHAAHFALWGRPKYLEKSMDWYIDHLEEARGIANRQGYDGVRWQKMSSPDGHSSPSNVGEFLIWQQPHIIYFAELLYRADPSKENLTKYKDLVFESAEFMASFAQFDSTDEKFHLCPPIIPAQERFKATETSDPIFELTYWEWGLKTAQIWKERLGTERNQKWQYVLAKLAPLPQDNDHYLPTHEATNFFVNAEKHIDHPIVVGAYGYLPNEQVDTSKMKRTFRDVMQGWNWETTWGWDYPLLAMTATRLYEPESAISALLMDTQKNTYLVNGHNYQNQRLSIYLPGNGGLLSAVAMMTAGFDGCTKNNPGFPDDWDVRWEGLSPMF
ncbi:MAG: hypothetical protein U5K79_16630 [Cyclobacteriaceae bacterium]|nr:hypothetical protein [Cyclobacteriaceae bacterium]